MQLNDWSGHEWDTAGAVLGGSWGCQGHPVGLALVTVAMVALALVTGT